jgi:hypothetical protein
MFWPGVFVWVVIGVLFVAEGDRLARIIGGVVLATWLIFVVRAYRRARPSWALFRDPRLWLAAAVVVLPAALAGAAYLHWHQAVYSCPPESLVLCRYTKKPGWADPAALAILLVGIGATASMLVTALRLLWGRGDLPTHQPMGRAHQSRLGRGRGNGGRTREHHLPRSGSS